MSLTATERRSVQDAIDLLTGLLVEGSVPVAAPPRFEQIRDRDLRERGWKFLKAIDEAGGSVSPKEISAFARANGLDPRGVNGYYHPQGCLRRAEDRRELTEVGREEIRRGDIEFGAAPTS